MDITPQIIILSQQNTPPEHVFYMGLSSPAVHHIPFQVKPTIFRPDHNVDETRLQLPPSGPPD